MIVLICSEFDIYKDGNPTGRKEFVASHGLDENGKTVIVEQCHPIELGAEYIDGIGWVLDPPPSAVLDF